MVRLHRFLSSKNSAAANRAIATIRKSVRMLAAYPQIGRPVEEMSPEFREWLVEFGQSAYVVLYHYDEREAVIVAVRHGREAGY